MFIKVGNIYINLDNVCEIDMDTHNKNVAVTFNVIERPSQDIAEIDGYGPYTVLFRNEDAEALRWFFEKQVLPPEIFETFDLVKMHNSHLEFLRKKETSEYK